MKSFNFEVARKQVFSDTSVLIIEAIATQMERIDEAKKRIDDEAKKRIDDEGIVVRDLKGSVIPHPAIKIEQDAVKLMSDLIKKNS